MRAEPIFYHPYRALLAELLSPHASIETNARTGRRIRSIVGGHSFKLDLSDDLLPVCGLRKLFPRSAAAEIAWFLQGTKDATWMMNYAPFWDKFVEDDGKTVDAAYGWRWRHHFGRDQIGMAFEALRADPSNRRVFVSAWDPGYDGLGAPNQKNVPCPTNFSLSIQEGHLHCSLFLRSSDVFVGLPYDVMGQALLMDAFACGLELEGLGTLHVTLGHAHLYESHWEMGTQCLLDEEYIVNGPELPNWTLEDIEMSPDAYVSEVAALAKRVEWPSYNPKPEVVA